MVCVWFSTVCVCMWTLSGRYFIEIKFVFLYNAVYSVSLFETLLARADSRDSFLPRAQEKLGSLAFPGAAFFLKSLWPALRESFASCRPPHCWRQPAPRAEPRLPGREERSQAAEASSLSPNRICAVSLRQLHNSRDVNRERCAISFPCETGLGHSHAAGAGRLEGTEFQLCKMNKL